MDDEMKRNDEQNPEEISVSGTLEIPGEFLPPEEGKAPEKSLFFADGEPLEDEDVPPQTAPQPPKAEKKPRPKKKKRFAPKLPEGKTLARLIAVIAAAVLVAALLITMGVRGRRGTPANIDKSDAVAVTAVAGQAGSRSGFPLTFPGGTILDLKPGAGGLFALTGDSLCFVSTSGAYRTPVGHKYVEPVLKTGGNYALIFDRLSGKFQLCDARKLITSGQSENGQQISTAAVSKKGEFLLAGKGVNYASLLTYYNKKGEILFSWECAQEYIVSVAIAENRRDLLCAAVSTRNGEMFTKIYRLNIGEKDIVWEITLPNTAATECAFAGGKDVALVCADKRLLIDTGSKKDSVKEAAYPAAATLCHSDGAGATAVVNQKLGTFDVYEISLYDKNNKAVISAETDQRPLSVFCRGKKAFLLTDTGIYRVRRSGKLGELCKLGETERGLVMVGSDAFHYNKNTLYKN